MDAAISKGNRSSVLEGACAVVCLVLVWLVVSALLWNSISKLTQQVVLQAAALLTLLTLHRHFNSDKLFNSQHALGGAGRLATIGSLGVVATYLVAFAYTELLDIPVEPAMMAIRATQGVADWALLLLSVVVLAPMWEELFFRRFLLGMFPVHRSGLWAVVGASATAAAFAAFHYLYEHPSTFVLLGVLGFIFAWVRIRSGTLWVPMVLHGVATVIGLLLNFLR